MLHQYTSLAIRHSAAWVLVQEPVPSHPQHGKHLCLTSYLALLGHLGLLGEGQRPLQDVLEGLVALLPPEGREAVQQLVDQDPEAPPVHAAARACRILIASHWNRSSCILV